MTFRVKTGMVRFFVVHTFCYRYILKVTRHLILLPINTVNEYKSGKYQWEIKTAMYYNNNSCVISKTGKEVLFSGVNVLKHRLFYILIIDLGRGKKSTLITFVNDNWIITCETHHHTHKSTNAKLARTTLRVICRYQNNN